MFHVSIKPLADAAVPLHRPLPERRKSIVAPVESTARYMDEHQNPEDAAESGKNLLQLLGLESREAGLHLLALALL